ncbi:hypothetical protein Ahy_A01g000602 [Arachis hypogaea]|uniref:CCHC-type domain-containing protein n=1 Tax=Arachis hypogaea TaxID=3818 RepID=A0A445EKL8_ARAHY|nr:hypothetical protein Ahy_A01g000602 [Arachis hypogaea]
MSGIPCVHAVSCIKFMGLDLEAFVVDYYKKEAYLKCYESFIIHPLNGPDLWERTTYGDVMPPPYRRPSHRLVKKRRPVAGEEEQNSCTHLSRRKQIRKCSICGSVGHNKNRCLKPIEEEAQQLKKLRKERIRSQAPTHILQLKTASSHPTAKIGVKRKTASATQPPSSIQSNSITQPKKPRGRLKKTTKSNCSAKEVLHSKKHTSPISSALSSSSTHLNTTSFSVSQPTLFTSSTQPSVQHKHTMR